MALQKHHIEIFSILLLYCFVAISSIVNISNISFVVFPILVAICAWQQPRTGLLALLAMFYLPSDGLGIPNPFIIASGIVLLINIKRINGNWLFVNKSLFILYTLFIILRFISFIFVENIDFFKNYFGVSFTVLVYLFVISILIDKKEDIEFILDMWRVIGAIAAILCFIHFWYYGNTYLNQLNLSSNDVFDKVEINNEMIRWIWPGLEPNFWGLQLLIPFAINLFYLINKINLQNICLTFINFLGILGTYSRSSLLVTLVVISCLLISSTYRKGTVSLHFNKLFVLLSGILFVIIIYLYIPQFVDRFDSIKEAAFENQGSGRYFLYEEAINNIFTHPFFGIGTGQTALISIYHKETHNLFLQVFAENGIFNFIILIGIFGNELKKSLSLSDKKSLFAIAIFAVAVNSNTVSFFDMRVLFTLFVILNYKLYFQKNDFTSNTNCAERTQGGD